MNIVDSPFHDKLLVSPDTLATHNALGKVSLDKRIDLFDNIELRYSLEFIQSDTHLRRQLAELTTIALITDKA